RVPRPPVRLLHPRRGPLRRRPAPPPPRPHRARGARVDRGQHLPLHRLPQHRPRRPLVCRPSWGTPPDPRRDPEGGDPMSTAERTAYVGASLARKEDRRFLTGSGRYTDDIVLPRQTYACIVRSPHASARITGIQTAAAEAAPGVVAVYTGKDL